MVIDPGKLETLKYEERKRFHLKESWQKRMISWFGLGAGISLMVEFGRAYYYLISSRHLLPDVADTSHIDLEFNALLGMAVGVVVAVVPILLSYVISKHTPRDFAAIRADDTVVRPKVFAFLSILVGVIILGLSVAFVAAAWLFQQETSVSGMQFVAIFGSMLLAGPLIVEGLWTLFAAKCGIEKVYVLRKDAWRSW